MNRAANFAHVYLRKYNLALTHCPPRSKGPQHPGWNKPGGYFTEPAAAVKHWETNPDDNMGVVLGASGLCSLDIDHVEYAKLILSETGIDIDQLCREYPTVCGNPERRRIEFSVPDGVTLSRKILTWPDKSDPTKLVAIFELRGGDVQDLLPPSIHPSGEAYKWITRPTGKFPQLPNVLLAIWNNWPEFERIAKSLCPWYVPPPAAKPRTPRQPPGDGVIEAFNRANKVEDQLEAGGYVRKGNRYMAPSSSTKLAGVVILDDKCYSHHGSDPLADGHSHDAFDVFRILQHKGDCVAAVKAAAAMLGITGQNQPGAGNATASGLEGEVKKLAAMSPLDYEQVRIATAERLNVRATVLDAEVKKLRAPDATQQGAGKTLGIQDVEPCPGPVDGVQLLEKIVSAISRFVALPEQADIALALWAVHTYAFDFGECSPILALISPTPRCGKTTTLNLLARLVNRPLSSSNISTAAIFRTVEVCRPTLLIDEADTFMRENEETRGIINSGHTRDSAYVIRTVGDDHEPRQFSTWAPKAIASISKLPGTIADRSIVISLRRKLPSDRVTRLTRQHQFHDLRAQITRWVIDHADKIAAANPDIPEELNDRAADNWRPLLALADLMGDKWPERARKAAKKISGERNEEAQGVLLLSDIQAIFKDKKADRIPSRTLVEALGAIEGRPWAEYRNGKPITANQLARILGEFGISPASTRSGDDTFKGYVQDKFSEVFERYLQNAPSGGEQKVTPSQANTGAGCDTSQTVTRDLGVTLRKPSQANTGAGCDGVTLREEGKGSFHDTAPQDSDGVIV